MQIKRDYSRSFFGTRRRRLPLRNLLLTLLLLACLLALAWTRRDNLQFFALNLIGQAPTPTPFASELATRGAALAQAGDLAAAAAQFQRAVQQRPDSLDYLYEYGKLLIELDQAEAVLTPQPLYGGLSLADRSIELNSQDVRGYALKARAFVWVDEAADAIPVGMAGLEQNNRSAPLYAALGRAYTRIGRYQQGLDFARQAVELDPLDAEARRSYAYALIWVGERYEAIRQLEDALSLQPQMKALYFELAAQYLATGQDELAIASYEHILSLDRNDKRAYLRLCQSWARVGQNDQAQGYCEDALAIDPEYADAWTEVGRARYTRRNYEGSIEAFDRCIEYGSSSIECWYLRGLAHYYLGHCDRAWSILNEALPLAQQLAEPGPIVANIREGLRLTTLSCLDYIGAALPTNIPPTPVPPTPIGG